MRLLSRLQRRRLPRLVFTLLLPFTGLLAASTTAQTAAPARNTQPRDCSVTLEGDSIPSGIYTADTRLPELPAALLRRMRPAYAVTDNSASGSTAFGRAPEFAKTPVTTRFVVLEHGINDAQFGKPYEPALRGMVAHVKAAGRIPIVTGLSRQPLSSRGRDTHDQTARRVAADTGSLFVDWGAVAFKPREMADVLHPGPAYSARQTAALWLDYRFANPELQGWSIGGGVRRVGKVPASADGSTFNPPYTLADAAVRYEHGPYAFALNATNLFDRRYVAGYGQFFGQGRTLQAKATFRW